MSDNGIDLSLLEVRPVNRASEGRFKSLMTEHHYLGFLPKISETMWYVGSYEEKWTSLLCFSASSWKCGARDRWIGWDFRHQYGRLKLVVNNSRFLILPDWHIPNLGSRVLSLCMRRLQDDWQRFFGHRLVLAETFVDPERFHGGLYRASNWQLIGKTQGYRRKNGGYTAKQGKGKLVFVRPLVKNAQRILSKPILDKSLSLGEEKMQLSADHMRSLLEFFLDIPDPRTAQGTRHSLPTVLAISAAAILCGMRGYKAISDWANSLGQQARRRFNCRVEDGRFVVPSKTRIRDVLVRVDPEDLDQALRAWNDMYAQDDESLAIDGKVMCNAIDSNGHQMHIMSAVGHNSKICYTQKKSVLSL